MPRTLRRTAMAAVLALAASSSPSLAAQPCPEVGFTLVEAAASPQTRPVKARGNQVIQVRREALTRTTDIVEARLEAFDHPALLLKFRPEAATRLENATTDHDGLRLAFVADDDALLSVVWQGRYGMGREGAQISISDRERAHRLFERLSACLPPGTVVPGDR